MDFFPRHIKNLFDLVAIVVLYYAVHGCQEKKLNANEKCEICSIQKCLSIEHSYRSCAKRIEFDLLIDNFRSLTYETNMKSIGAEPFIKALIIDS